MMWAINQTVHFDNGKTAMADRLRLSPMAYPGNGNAHAWAVTCMENGSTANLIGATAAAYFKRMDGNTVVVPCTISGNVVTAVFPTEVYAVPGVVTAVMNLSIPEMLVISVAAITFIVQQPVDGNLIDPSGEITLDVETLIADIASAVASIPVDYTDLMESIAPIFDSSESYSAGDYVWYSGALKRFTDDHAAGAWVGTDTVEVVLGNDLADLKSRINSITTTTGTSKNLYDKSSCNPADQCMYNSSGEYTTGQSSYATTGKIPCDAQTEYTFNAGAAKTKSIRFFSGIDGSTFISGETYSSPQAQATFTTPENCTFVAINLFGNTHTTNEYNEAINASQLELGDEATPYEPYGDAIVVPLNAVEKGNVISDFVDLIGSATTSDEGKLVKTKSVTNGEVTEWEFVDDKSDEITEELASKNLYDKTSCSPADGYTYNSSGEYTATEYFATSGKIPVDAETQYTFSANNTVKNVRYFKGASGETFISGENTSGTFTTPALCTFVAVQLFSNSHTTEQYNAAMAVAQLEKGAISTDYEPYGTKLYVPLSVVEDGDKLQGVSDVVSNQSQINLYNKALAENGKAYSSGVPVVGADYAISGLIPVKPNTQYCISIDPDAPMDINAVVYEYNSSKTYTGKIQNGLGNYVYRYLISFATSATTYFISANLYKASHTAQDFADTINTMMLCYGTQRPLTYAAYNSESVVLAEKLSNSYFNPECFTGKKWMATGTSITWYDSKTYEVGLTQGEICRGYVGNVARRKRLIVNNQGISGSTLGDVNENSLINRYQSLDWVNTDIVTLEYGVNDLGQNIPVGTAGDSAGTTTFAACLKTVIEYALAQNPTICLVICTEPDVRGTNTNSNGNTLKDFADVTLEVAAQYRLPVCDWYYNSGINALNKGDQAKTWMTIDGTHPSDAGHLRMGAMLNQVFDSLIC